MSSRQQSLKNLTTHHLCGNYEVHSADAFQASCRASKVIWRKSGEVLFTTHCVYQFRLTKIKSSWKIAGNIARAAGLQYAYVGNVQGVPDIETTYCPNCKRPVIERNIYVVTHLDVVGGKCRHCQTKIAGVWGT